MKITTDTNVLISSTFWEGVSDKIMQKVENKEVELILSRELINEFMEVLDYDEIKDKIKDKNLKVRRSVEKIISISTIVEPSQKFEIVKDDLDDNMVINCAVEGNVDYVVTQDEHLLKIKEFKGIKIVKPEEFLWAFEKV
ncbi:MAG TPA: putative toxin-antitoxin system toxin component, PIN family [Candidatus Nanoarchaeia archaeon]|nr:putative toxin-antitoxin system toxin component, PIN family [Candidatus Nanoarchaeia archaeon]